MYENMPRMNFKAVECSHPRKVYSAIRSGAKRFHGSYRSLNDGKPFSGLMLFFEPLYLEPLITRWPKALHFSGQTHEALLKKLPPHLL